MLQRVTLPLRSSIDDAALEKSLKQLVDIFRIPHGPQTWYWGRRVENSDIVEVFIIWSSLPSFGIFTTSSFNAEYGALINNLSANPSHYFAAVIPTYPETVLTAAVVEVLTFSHLTSNRHLDSVRLPNFRRRLGECKGWAGDAVGPGVDAITWEEVESGHGGDGKGKSWFILGGWESVEVHKNFQASEAFKERPGVDGDVEACHVVFKRMEI